VAAVDSDRADHRQTDSVSSTRSQVAFLLTTLIGLGAGLGAASLGWGRTAAVAWTAITLLGLTAALYWMWSALREHRPSVDIIAVLALVGSLVIGEPLAGAVIAVMLATGQWLEARSAARAERELRLLVQRRPTHARRLEGDEFVLVPAGEIRRGDEIVVPTGEIVPVDGRLLESASLDESALTGESLPVDRAAGEIVRSGSVNAGPPARLTATATEANSSYSGIVDLVTRARATSAPLVRTADRFALFFVPLTLIIAGLAWWLSGDGARAVAVLVVATPCPLILAAPIALIAGMSQASRRGVIVKGGAALERLSAGRVLLIDKTGTITAGRPRLNRIVTETGGEGDQMLQLAASLEQLSPHVLASAMVVAAGQRGLRPTRPERVVEKPGAGIEGMIADRAVSLGSVRSFPGDLPGWARRAQLHAGLDGALTVLMVIDGKPSALFVFDDPIRLDAARMLRDLREAGIRRTVLVTGDRTDVAELVGSMVGIDAVEAETDPTDKARIVLEQATFGSTVMVGDGINDAPALATADVGVALATRGTSASSEAAQVVMMTDSLDALADTMLISQRSHRYALAAASVGMGLSLAAMVPAAFGLLAPVAGAVVQEVIDVLAMLIALTAAIPRRRRRPTFAIGDGTTVEELHLEHEQLKDLADQLRAAADALTSGQSLQPLHQLLARLEKEQIPHERAEEQRLYPLAARALGGVDPMAALSRAHAEIERQVRHLRGMLDTETPDDEDVIELRRVLYGLYAVLRLHNAQEEEIVFSLRRPADDSGSL